MCDLKTDAGRRRYLELLLASMAERMGFAEIPPIPGLFHGISAEWSFSKPQKPLGVAALSFGYFRKPKRRLLVQFLGSRLGLTALLESGIEGNAIAYNLHQFQRYQMDIDPESVLPMALPLSAAPEEWAQMIERMDDEIRRVETAVWQHLDLRLAMMPGAQASSS